VIDVRYERGVYLPQQNLWLDPWEAKDFAFVSHAHSDHIAPHREIIVSERTASLMRARLPGKRNEIILPFSQEKVVRGMRLTLFPAGHIFGSAQLFLRTENDSLLYTGDFKLRQGQSAEATEWTAARTLIMETTYGIPRYRPAADRGSDRANRRFLPRCDRRQGSSRCYSAIRWAKRRKSFVRSPEPI
jgi:Cft2 family RNA processing exonuclease